MSWVVAACCVAPSLLSRAPWELGWGWVALGFLGNSREEPGNTSSGRKAAAEAREPEGRPGQAGARHCLYHRPVLLPLAPPCATQFGHKQLLVRLLSSDLRALRLALSCLLCRSCTCSPPWLSVCPAWGRVVAHVGIPAPGEQRPLAGLAPHFPGGPGDSPQPLGSRERRS